MARRQHHHRQWDPGEECDMAERPWVWTPRVAYQQNTRKLPTTEVVGCHGGCPADRSGIASRCDIGSGFARLARIILVLMWRGRPCPRSVMFMNKSAR